jgi:uncharacterized membrane protein YhaH (DUF805 family)
VDFFEAVKTCLRKYATFSGRAGRPEYWWFMLFVFGVSVVAQLVGGDQLNAIASLILLLPMLSAAARRLHDTGKSGWFQLVGVIPFIGWVLMVVWLCQRTVGPNEYGAGPELPRDDPLEIPPHV